MKTSLKVAKVCVCDGMPGLHNFSSGCNTEDGYVAFVPTEKELATQAICNHCEDGNPPTHGGEGNDEENTRVYEGVCADCGKMVDEKEAARWAKKSYKVVLVDIDGNAQTVMENIAHIAKDKIEIFGMVDTEEEWDDLKASLVAVFNQMDAK